MSSPLELFLFTTDTDLARRAIAAGVDGIVVDWERAGKHERQRSVDTEINEDTHEDLRRVREATCARIICRVNPVDDRTPAELEAAVAGGADEVLVPMVRAPEQVETVLELAGGRVGVGVLVETNEAVARATELAALPVSRVFVGLNDLAIERGSSSIFSALSDGTVDGVSAAFSAPVGVAGITLPDRGEPIPARLVIAELARLRCRFTSLRRSFRRDVAGRDLSVEIPRMRLAVEVAWARSQDEVARDRAELVALIAELETGE